MRNAYKGLVRKLEWKRPLRRARRRWKNSTKMDLIRVRTGFKWLRIGSITELLQKQ
jgi:hypothetical protein